MWRYGQRGVEIAISKNKAEIRAHSNNQINLYNGQALFHHSQPVQNYWREATKSIAQTNHLIIIIKPTPESTLKSYNEQEVNGPKNCPT